MHLRRAYAPRRVLWGRVARSPQIPRAGAGGPATTRRSTARGGGKCRAPQAPLPRRGELVVSEGERAVSAILVLQRHEQIVEGWTALTPQSMRKPRDADLQSRYMHRRQHDKCSRPKAQTAGGRAEGVSRLVQLPPE